MNLDKKLIKVVANFLKEYSEILGEKCCCDLSREEYEYLKDLFTDEELIRLEKEFQFHNGTPEDFDQNHLTLLMYNWALPSLMANKLNELS